MSNDQDQKQTQKQDEIKRHLLNVLDSDYYGNPTENPLAMDQAHQDLDFMDTKLAQDIWASKYRYGEEKNFAETAARVCSGVYALDNDNWKHATSAFQAMVAGLWMPAGRILAGAGTPKRVTLQNCYVTGTIEDSMEGIMTEHTNFALTMQQGGGDGADFSPIRPEGAILVRTGTAASGPLPFMRMWNSMCTTIRSAGDRRGAMMGVISDTHPDMPKIVVAKQTPGELTNFNISILVSDAFMEAVHEDADWPLHFHIAPLVRESYLADHDFVDDKGVQQYVYAVWKARELWEMITRNTYEYSEPGVIFIDRINELNNLHYCEEIRCTNPCGEQPLGPHSACNLGHVNLARLVRNPFSPQAKFNWDLLKHLVTLGVRFLDNVIDVSLYPLVEQQEMQQQKRLIGLGFTGLADAMVQLGLRYGSLKAAEFADEVERIMCWTAYDESIELARERGSFPLFDGEQYLAPHTFAGKMLPENLKEDIKKHGIRNGRLLTIAPTGTTSCVYGNPAGGLEPFFLNFTRRKVLQGDGTHKAYTDWSYSARLYRKMRGVDDQNNMNVELPSYFVTAQDLTVHDHIAIQSRIQKWVDASVSKTINIPKEMPYEEFVQVYDLAYNAGCKGTTTYRPSDVRGSVLDDPNAFSPPASDKNASTILQPRPERLNGTTYKISWPGRESAIYLTLNVDECGRPFEILITSKDQTHSEWTTALSLMITGLFRKGGDISFVPEQLLSIQSLNNGAFLKQRYFGSLPAYIGYLIQEHMRDLGEIFNADDEPDMTVEEAVEILKNAPSEQVLPALTSLQSASSQPHMSLKGSTCPQCKAPTVFRVEACKKCSSCGWSEC